MGRDRIYRVPRAGIMARPQPTNTPNVPPMGVRGFSPLPSAAYSCYEPCPDGSSEQVPEYIPYLFTPYYKRVKIKNGVRGVDDLFNVCVPEYNGGFCKTWWFVKCFGWDVVRDTTDPDAPPLPEEVANTGTPYSMLKLEVIGTEYGKFKARFVLDIGSRTDVSIGAYQRLEAHVLIPDFQRYEEEGGLVLDDPPYNLQDWRAKSLIVPSAVGVEALGGFKNGRFTQSLLLQNPGQTFQTMDIPPAAKQVVVWTDDPTAATPTLTFLSVFGLPVATVVPALGEPVEIPDNAEQVRVTIGAGDAGPRIVTLIFKLDV